MEKINFYAKCPKCGRGEMMMALSPVPMQALLARCNKCGFEDDYIKIYPVKDSK